MLLNSKVACVDPVQASSFQGTSVSPLGKECRFRASAGQYVSVTKNELSLPRTFDLPAWVATDPFFAPLRANTALQLEGLAVQTEDAFQPPIAAPMIAASQPPLMESVGLQTTDCPVIAKEDSFGGATAEANFLNPPMLETKQSAPVTPPPRPQPIRGMW